MEWINGQELRLKKKNDWWGDAYRSENVYFEANPSEIIFKIIPDETVALQGLKDGSIDVLAKISPDNFRALKEDSSQAERYHFATPILMQYVHIVLNTKNPKLRDKRVRRALAHLIDMDYIVEDLFEGFATPTIGPINPTKEYYRSDLPVRELDVVLAREYLEEAGWTDSEGDGVVDQVINGAKVDLVLNMEVSGGLGEQLALVMQEKFREAGINLKIERKEFRLIREEMQKGDFDMAAMLTRQAPSLVDLYQSLHSDNANVDGGNFSKFGTAQSDSIISEIRVALDPDVRRDLYGQIQEIIYDQQPSLFLVSPKQRIVVSKNWEFKEAQLRPGIFEQELRIKN
jgi:peptide/nickel transport system substrate-binding protein